MYDKRKLSLECYGSVYDSLKDKEVMVLSIKAKKEYSKPTTELISYLSNIHGINIDIQNIEVSSANVYHNPDILKEIFSYYDDDFCLDFNIMYDNKKIGNVSLSRIFAASKLDILSFIDAELPQSEFLGVYICNNEFEKIKNGYIGIVDAISIDEEYQNNEVEAEILDIISDIVCEIGLDINTLYIQALSTKPSDYGRNIKDDKLLDLYKKNEYVLLDKSNNIMSIPLFTVDCIEHAN